MPPEPGLFVLDTSLFTDGRVLEHLGASSLDAMLTRLSALFEKARVSLGVGFYVTPSVRRELRAVLFSAGASLESITSMEVWLTVKAPDKFTTRIPGFVMWEYVSEVRRRLVRLMKSVEEAIRVCGSRETGELLRTVKEKFRDAAKRGIVDSPEDLDLVLLALEVRGVVVTNDKGLHRMCRTLGLTVMEPPEFVRYLEKVLEAVERYNSPGQVVLPIG